LNTGDYEVLRSFLGWGVEMFPADHYDFHIMDHGGGWMGACIDEPAENSMIRGFEFAEVFNDLESELGKNIDLVSFDACFMASFEFGWEVCDSVDHLVGMQTIAAGDDDDGYTVGNFDVRPIWSGLKENPDWTPAEFAHHQVESLFMVGPFMMPSLGQTHPYSSDTMAASDLTKLKDLKTSFTLLAEELYYNVTGPNSELAVRQLINQVLGPATNTPELTTESFAGQPDYLGLGLHYLFDLGDFVDRLILYGDKLCSKETAEEFKILFEDVIINCNHGEDAKMGEHPDAQGLDIYIPYRNGRYNSLYSETRIAQDTLWDDFLLEVPWHLY
jgi:hypothetical protein